MRPSGVARSIVVYSVIASLCFISPLVVTSGGNAVLGWEGDTRTACKIVVFHQFTSSALQLLEKQLVGCLVPSMSSLGKQVFSGVSTPGENEKSMWIKPLVWQRRSCREMHWLFIRLDLFFCLFVCFFLKTFWGIDLSFLGWKSWWGAVYPPRGPVLHRRQRCQPRRGAVGNVSW